MPEAELPYLKQFLLRDRFERLEAVLQQRTRHIAVVLENVHHDHNASACLRSMDCLGIQDAHVIDSDNQFRANSDVALGASKWLTVHRYHASNEGIHQVSQLENCYQNLRNQGYRILATSPRQESIPLSEIAVDRPLAIVFGAEQVGVSDQAINDADGLIHIPMYGFTESFNISVSAAVILHQMTVQLRNSDVDWRLTEHQQQDVMLHWVRQSLGAKYEPLKRRFDKQNSSE